MDIMANTATKKTVLDCLLVRLGILSIPRILLEGCKATRTKGLVEASKNIFTFFSKGVYF